MELNEIKNNLIITMRSIEEYLYSLDEKTQDEILDISKVPSEKKALFIDHCYTGVNQLIQEINTL